MWIFVIDARFCARRGYQGGHATTAAAHDTAQMQIDATFALFSLLMLALSLLLPAPTPRHPDTASPLHTGSDPDRQTRTMRAKR
jgi:hypothetical protein